MYIVVARKKLRIKDIHWLVFTAICMPKSKAFEVCVPTNPIENLRMKSNMQFVPFVSALSRLDKLEYIPTNVWLWWHLLMKIFKCLSCNTPDRWTTPTQLEAANETINVLWHRKYQKTELTRELYAAYEAEIGNQSSIKKAPAISETVVTYYQLAVTPRMVENGWRLTIINDDILWGQFIFTP